MKRYRRDLLPFDLPLPARFRNERWKVKIREKENREPPHLTILRGTQAWRIDLRTGEFMDKSPDPADLPVALLAHIHEATVWELLVKKWDAKYPNNPVNGPEESA